MSDKDDGGQAFPLGANEYGGHGPQAGMTLRDYFAAKAMQSMLLSSRDGGWNVGIGGRDNGHIAEIGYALADAMLSERAK